MATIKYEEQIQECAVTLMEGWTWVQDPEYAEDVGVDRDAYALRFNRSERILDIEIKTKDESDLKAVQEIMSWENSQNKVELTFPDDPQQVLPRRRRSIKVLKILRVFEKEMTRDDYNSHVAAPLKIDQVEMKWWDREDEFERGRREPPTMHSREPPTTRQRRGPSPLVEYDLEDYDSDERLPLVSASVRNGDRTMCCPSLHRKR